MSSATRRIVVVTSGIGIGSRLPTLHAVSYGNRGVGLHRLGAGAATARSHLVHDPDHERDIPRVALVDVLEKLEDQDPCHVRVVVHPEGCVFAICRAWGHQARRRYLHGLELPACVVPDTGHVPAQVVPPLGDGHGRAAAVQHHDVAYVDILGHRRPPFFLNRSRTPSGRTSSVPLTSGTGAAWSITAAAWTVVMASISPFEKRRQSPGSPAATCERQPNGRTA